jgi:hypothetical protein
MTDIMKLFPLYSYLVHFVPSHPALISFSKDEPANKSYLWCIFRNYRAGVIVKKLIKSLQGCILYIFLQPKIIFPDTQKGTNWVISNRVYFQSNFSDRSKGKKHFLILFHMKNFTRERFWMFCCGRDEIRTRIGEWTFKAGFRKLFSSKRLHEAFGGNFYINVHNFQLWIFTKRYDTSLFKIRFLGAATKRMYVTVQDGK